MFRCQLTWKIRLHSVSRMGICWILRLRQQGPSGTYGFLLGAGEGSERFVFEGGNERAMERWGRREFVKDARRLDEESAFSQELSDQLANEADTLAFKCNLCGFECGPVWQGLLGGEQGEGVCA